LVNPGNPPSGKAKLIVWDLATQQVVLSHEGHNGRKTYVGATRIWPDLVAVGGSDSISFVNPAKAEIVDQWQGVPGAVIDLAISNDRKHLASTGWDGVVRLWDVPREENPLTIDLDSIATELSFSPSGDRLVSVQSGGVVLRDSVSFQVVRRLEGEAGPVFSPIGNRLVTISEKRSKIRVWDYLSGRQAQPPVVLEGHTIERVAFSTDGKWVGCVTESGAVVTFEIASVY
jgi:WD40 repeat protein